MSAAELPNFDDVLAAARRLDGQAARTPLLESPLLNRAAGRRILVKAECLQLTGSFKFRGAWSHLSKLIEEGRRPERVLAYSSGNHAQGVALASARFGLSATIVMPSDAPAMKRRTRRPSARRSWSMTAPPAPAARRWRAGWAARRRRIW